MTQTLPILFAAMLDPQTSRKDEAREYQMLPNRPAAWNGWRAWTMFLGAVGIGATIWAITNAQTFSDLHRVVTTIASICGGSAVVVGFLWKLLGENSLTVIKMKDTLIAELQRSHGAEMASMGRDIQQLKEELNQLRELNLALQRFNLDLTSERDDLVHVKTMLEGNLSSVTTQRDISSAKIVQLQEMLDLAERKIHLLSPSSVNQN